ncbi:DUF1266 domain-containing protein [Streptomyces sp. F001]|uniref:DUF1266 domain-containing protein n=1 Tax=Streptomyces sp. F001 TaxID=1510026 RepID=UPI0026BECD88
MADSAGADGGDFVDIGYWRQAVGKVLRAKAAGSTVLGPDGVTKNDARPESETEAQIEGVQRLIGRITRYEARMRADGVLDENRYVTSVDAWDLGRASKMARWGLGARYGTLQEAESAVIEAGRKAALSYRSWPEFSAGGTPGGLSGLRAVGGRGRPGRHSGFPRRKAG